MNNGRFVCDMLIPVSFFFYCLQFIFEICVFIFFVFSGVFFLSCYYLTCKQWYSNVLVDFVICFTKIKLECIFTCTYHSLWIREYLDMDYTVLLRQHHLNHLRNRLIEWKTHTHHHRHMKREEKNKFKFNMCLKFDENLCIQNDENHCIHSRGIFIDIFWNTCCLFFQLFGFFGRKLSTF